jgi:anthranilate phosphoribosyltransferase
VRRSRRTGFTIVLPLQQHLDVAERTTSQADVHHGADQHSHHVMQEAVGLHMESHSPSFRTGFPLGQKHSAAVMRFLALDCKGLEVAFSADMLSSSIQELEVERTPERPLEAAAKRRCGSAVQPDDVAVAPGNRRLAGVEPREHRVHRCHPAVGGEQCVERAVKRLIVPAGRSAEADALAFGVHSGIGPAGCVSRGAAAEDTFEDPLEFELNRAAGRLALPSDKAGAVVVKRGEEGPAHGPEFSPGQTPEQGCNCLSELTKGASDGYTFLPSLYPHEPRLTHARVAPVTDDSALSFALQQVARGLSLSREEATAATDLLMAGRASPAQAAALLMGLRVKGESPQEVAGAAQALRRAMLRVELAERDGLVDTCGTGGGRVGTVNISTAAAFIIAGAGVPVAKHGNRSFTSRCGSADVLEALGVEIGLEPSRAAEVLRSAGMIFMFAPIYHPAMRHLAAVRKELGIPTIMNLVGPLANPAGVTRQVLGVSDPARGPLLAGALAELGARHALVLHAWVGMDEISPSGLTCVWEVADGQVSSWELNPADLGLECNDLDALAGGEPGDNADQIERLLAGRGSRPLVCATLLNAAAALYVSGNGWSLEQSVERCRTALESGAGAAALERLRAAAPKALART